MKNLYKKVSAVALASMVVLGGVAVNGVQSFAASNQIVSRFSNKPKFDPHKFIGESKDFENYYKKIIDKFKVENPEEAKKYENMIDKIEMIVKGLPGKMRFRLYYAALPGEVLKQIEKEGYKLDNLFNGSALYVDNMINLLYYRFSMYQGKNYIVNIKDSNNKVYKFIFFVDNK